MSCIFSRFTSGVPIILSPIFLGLSTVTFLSYNHLLLISARLLQGISTSLIWSCALPCLRYTLDNSQRDAMTLMSTMTSIGAVLGPFAGGWVFLRSGWTAVAIMASAVIAIDMIAVYFGIQNAKKEDDQEVHIQRSKAMRETPSLLQVSMEDSPLLSSLEPRQNHHSDIAGSKSSATLAFNSSPRASTSMAKHDASDVLGEAAAVVEDTLTSETARSSLWALLTNKRMAAALFGRFVAVLLVTGVDVVLPTYLFEDLLWDSGLISVALSILATPSLISPVIERLHKRYGATAVAPLGCLLTASVGLLRYVRPGQFHTIPLLLGVVFATGVGLVTVTAPLSAEIASVVEDLDGDLSNDDTDVADQAQTMLHLTIYAASTASALFCGWAAQSKGWNVLTLGWSCLSLVAAVFVMDVYKVNVVKVV